MSISWWKTRATGATGAKARPRVVSPESGRPSAHTSRSARLPTLSLSWPKLKLIIICVYIYIYTYIYIYIYIYIRWIYQTQSWIYQTQSWFKAFQTFQGHGLLFQHVSVSYILQPSGWAKPDTHVLGDSDLSEFWGFFRLGADDLIGVASINPIPTIMENPYEIPINHH